MLIAINVPEGIKVTIDQTCAEVCVGEPVLGLPPAGLLQREGEPVQGEVLVMPDNLGSQG